jgi:hypothetical protein
MAAKVRKTGKAIKKIMELIIHSLFVCLGVAAEGRGILYSYSSIFYPLAPYRLSITVP